MFGQIPGHGGLAKLTHKINYYTGNCGPIQHDHLLLQSQQEVSSLAGDPLQDYVT